MNSLYKEYNVELDNSKYDILIGRNILVDNLIKVLNEKTKNKNIVLIFDAFFKNKVSNLVSCLSKAGYNVYSHPMEAGKHNKNINEVIKIYRLLEVNGFSRDSTVVSLGGGVIGDLVGFVASTYLRGINLVHIPTTLMAMIDSSLGGKVAINFQKTINAIGNYYHPILNIIDLEFIDSLPLRDFKAGLAEIIKCAIISDKELFDYLESNTERILKQEEEALLFIISHTIEIKLKHVSGDVREGGKRLKLNYGHTMGHSIEISTAIPKETYRHGEGVALGMVGTAFLAKEHLQKDDSILKMHEKILAKYDLPTKVDAKKIGFDSISLIKQCMQNIYKDKKRKDNKLRFILPEEIGRCGIYNNVQESLIKKAFEYVIGE